MTNGDYYNHNTKAIGTISLPLKQTSKQTNKTQIAHYKTKDVRRWA